MLVLQSIPPEPRLCLIVCRNNYSGTRRSYLICSSILLCPQLHVTNYTNMQSLKGSNHSRIWLTCLEGCKHIVLKAVDEITPLLQTPNSLHWHYSHVLKPTSHHITLPWVTRLFLVVSIKYQAHKKWKNINKGIISLFNTKFAELTLQELYGRQ